MPRSLNNFSMQVTRLATPSAISSLTTSSSIHSMKNKVTCVCSYFQTLWRFQPSSLVVDGANGWQAASSRRWQIPWPLCKLHWCAHFTPQFTFIPVQAFLRLLNKYLSHYRRLSFYLEALRPDAWVKPTRGVHARVLLSIEQSTLDHRLEQKGALYVCGVHCTVQ